MSEPEAVKMVFACGPGMCDMDACTTAAEGIRIFAGGAEGMLKVSVAAGECRQGYGSHCGICMAARKVTVASSAVTRTTATICRYV